MAPSKIRRALGAVKDKTSIGLAKVGSTNSFADLEVAIVKATRHEEYPAEERHIREILSLTCYSRANISVCVNFIAKRLNKTNNWTVALKTLLLVQRLLSDGDPAYEQEIFFSTRSGTRFLNMSDFRDGARSDSWDFSAFVRTFALYLDERLEFRMQSRRGRRSVFGWEDREAEEEEEKNEKEERNNRNHNNKMAIVTRATPVQEMKTDRILSRAHHLQQLLERFLACRPTGAAKNNRVVIVALYPTIKDSFQIYYDITEILSILIDRFMELDVPACFKVFEIFCRASKQFDELDTFYSWSRSSGIARSSEYPDVEKISPKRLNVMDELIREKSAMAQSLREKSKRLELEKEDSQAASEQESKLAESGESEEDMNRIKALPAPEPQPGAVKLLQEEEKKEGNQGEKLRQLHQQVDLLDLGEGPATTEDRANMLALALFDGEAATTGPSEAPAWQAFSYDNNADWEMALIQSASTLSGPKASLGGGFDMQLLNGMYMQGIANAAMAGPGFGVRGSPSSVALGSVVRPAMLALPAPPVPNGGSGEWTGANKDPFCASVGVAPPAYVQMSEMEKKQRLLLEEQFVWQQYARGGMQGQPRMARLQPQYIPYYNTGEHMPRY